MGENQDIIKALAERLDRKTPAMDWDELKAFVGSYIDRRQLFLDAALKHGSPLYLVEEDILLERAARFRKAFEKELPRIDFFYAMKSNHHPAIVETLIKARYGIDVSSGWELKQAIDLGANDIIFSGPGKTDDELRDATKYARQVMVLIDSFSELERLQRIAREADIIIRAGVRLTTDERGLWRKFGISPARLEKFFDAAEKCRHIRLCGLQFHTSWNLNPDSQVAFIERLSRILEQSSPRCRAAIEFIDIGGGYWPPQGEWLQYAGTPEGRLACTLDPDAGQSMPHYRLKAAPIEEFGRRVGEAIRTHIFPLLDCRIYLEPGRWICNDAMHLLLKVIDKKANDLVITDAGTNAVGWERFETDYFPIIDLSRPALTEKPCLIMGSLCTPHDIWGYAYFGRDIRGDDILLIPTQGAYTYSLRQRFIKPLPETVVINGTRVDRPGTNHDENRDLSGLPHDRGKPEPSLKNIDVNSFENRIWKRIKKGLLPSPDIFGRMLPKGKIRL